MCIYMYMYIYLCACVCVFIYICVCGKSPLKMSYPAILYIYVRITHIKGMCTHIDKLKQISHY